VARKKNNKRELHAAGLHVSQSLKF